MIRKKKNPLDGNTSEKIIMDFTDAFTDSDGDFEEWKYKEYLESEGLDLGDYRDGNE
jgi:hypothetical protein